MWRSRKFIVMALLAAVLLVGGIGGVALAQAENGDDSQPKARNGALCDRVCQVYEEKTGDPIDPQVLRDSFAQARSEMRDAAMETRLQYLVDEGKITQDEAGQYKEWWESRPDMPVKFGFRGRGVHHGFGGLCASGNN